MSQDLQFDVNLPDISLESQGQGDFDTEKQVAKVKNKKSKQSGSQKPLSGFARACGCLTTQFWSEYFNIDQTELLARLKASLNPKSSELIEKIHQKPDLYGPFWVCTTLIFTLTVSQSLFGVIVDIFTASKTSETEFDFNKINLGISVVYGAFFIFPLIFILANKVFGSNVPVIKSASIYGYSFVIFVIASIICVIPIGFLRVVVLILAGIHSIVFLGFNFKEYYEAYIGNSKLVVIALIGLTQLFLTCIFIAKFY